jgi:hypothetical protein
MTRRELVQRVAGAIAVSGAGLTDIKIVKADAQPVIAVFELPRFVNPEVYKAIKTLADEAFAEAGFPNIRALVLGDGMKVTMFDRMGGVSSQQVEDWLASASATETA